MPDLVHAYQLVIIFVPVKMSLVVFTLVSPLPKSHLYRVRNLKFATYLKFATCQNTNKINELW